MSKHFRTRGVSFSSKGLEVGDRIGFAGDKHSYIVTKVNDYRKYGYGMSFEYKRERKDWRRWLPF